MKSHVLPSILIFALTAAGMMTGCPVGGGCQYVDYAGVVTIENVRSQSGETTASGPSDEQLFIFYTFKADSEAPGPVSSFSENMLLTRREIEQKEIKPGRQFRAKAGYLDRGTCNPGPYLEKFEKWQ